eukprot:6181794-Pleurochrysis_carterae.AAC.1
MAVQSIEATECLSDGTMRQRSTPAAALPWLAQAVHSSAITLPTIDSTLQAPPPSPPSSTRSPLRR